MLKNNLSLIKTWTVIVSVCSHIYVRLSDYFFLEVIGKGNDIKL